MVTDAEPAPRSTGGGHTRRDIQGLRAIAVALVVLYHAGTWVPGGFVGVDVFFVVSGFVITAMLMREWRASGRIDLLRFYLRRVKRLTPALAVMLLVTLAGSAVLLSPFGVQQRAALTALGSIGLVGNAVIALTSGGYFDPEAELNPLLHTWSLSVEEQFYLFFPFAILLGFGASRRNRRGVWPAFAVTAGVAVGSFVLALAGGSDFSGGPLAALDPSGVTKQNLLLLLGFYSPLSRAWEFAVGALLALVAERVVPRRAPVAAVTGALSLAALVASVWLIDSTIPWPGPFTLLPTIATVGLIWSGLDAQRQGWSNPVSALFGTTPMVRVGDWSYSIYLWHWPFIVFAGQVWPGVVGASLAGVLSLVPAVASYYLVEQPLRRMESGLGKVMQRVVLATALPSVACALLVFVASQNYWWIPGAQRYAASVGPAHLVQEVGCDQRRPLSSLRPGQCTWNGEAGGRPLYLLGDSQAGQLSEAAVETARLTRRPLTISTTNACPFVVASFVDRRSGFAALNADCRRYVAGSMAFLQKAPPGTVIIANADVYWTDDGFAAGPINGKVSTAVPQRLQALSTGMDATVRQLRAAGHHVVVAHSTPRWHGAYHWSPQECGMYRIARGDCEAQMTVTEAGSLSSSVRNQLAARVLPAGGYLWDTWTTLCPDGVCRTSVDGRVQYRDSGHITAARSQSLGEELMRVVTSADAMT